jgi:hypothetical protein
MRETTDLVPDDPTGCWLSSLLRRTSLEMLPTPGASHYDRFRGRKK